MALSDQILTVLYQHTAPLPTASHVCLSQIGILDEGVWLNSPAPFVPSVGLKLQASS